MPEIEKFYQDHPENLITISGDPPDDIEEVMRERKLTFPVLYDEKGQVFARYGVRGIPVTFIIDADGNISGQLPGAVTSRELKKYLP